MTAVALNMPGLYGALVRLRRLIAILIAAAMLFAPSVLQSGAAMAMAPADHHAQMMEGGHCDKQPAQTNHHKAPDKSCCAAMCVATAVVPSAWLEPQMFAAVLLHPSLAQFHRSFLAELPTPPPRRA